MKPELIIAIRERLTLGHTEEAVKAELAQAGYGAQTIEEAYNFAQSGEAIAPADIPAVTESGGHDTTTEVKLPGVFALVSEGLAFVKQRFNVVMLLVAAGVVMLAADILTNMEIATTLAAEIGLLIATLVGFGFYIIALTAILYLVSKADNNSVTIPEAVTWARQNALSLIWLWLLSTLVVLGGFILLIIPGFIVMVYVALAQYVYVAEGKRGMDALVRSRDLISGYWWPLAFRLGGAWVIFILGMILVGIVGALLLTALGFTVGESLIGDSLLAVLSQAIGAIYAVAGIKIGYHLYEIMAAQRPHRADAPPTSKKGYVTLAVIGGLFIPITVIVLASLNSAREIGMEAAFMQELSATRVQAELHAGSDVSGNSSYRGFCATVDRQTTFGSITDCIDGEDFWFISAQAMDSGVEYCVGSDFSPVQGSIAADGRSCEPGQDSKTRATDLRRMTE